MIQEYLAHHDNYPHHNDDEFRIGFVLNDFQSFPFVGLSRKRGFQPQLITMDFQSIVVDCG